MRPPSSGPRSIRSDRVIFKGLRVHLRDPPLHRVDDVEEPTVGRRRQGLRSSRLAPERSWETGAERPPLPEVQDVDEAHLTRAVRRIRPGALRVLGGAIRVQGVELLGCRIEDLREADAGHALRRRLEPAEHRADTAAPEIEEGDPIGGRRLRREVLDEEQARVVDRERLGLEVPDQPVAARRALAGRVGHDDRCVRAWQRVRGVDTRAGAGPSSATARPVSDATRTSSRPRSFVVEMTSPVAESRASSVVDPSLRTVEYSLEPSGAASWRRPADRTTPDDEPTVTVPSSAPRTRTSSIAPADPSTCLVDRPVRCTRRRSSGAP